MDNIVYVDSSPREVISAITGRQSNKNLTPHLERMFESSRSRQLRAGVLFELTFEEYLTLISKGRRRTMQQALNRGNLKGFMESDRGYVLTWKGRAEKAAGVMNLETAMFVNREASRRAQHLKKGDTHREDSIEAIRQSRLGKRWDEETIERIRQSNAGQTRSDETRQRISAARKGTKDKEVTKAAKSEAAKARWAAYRAAKEKNVPEGIKPH
ncbi:hypothetical protein J2Y48_002482 [Mycoplana sp. BE70]|uniref:NUMOD3 domain-containing DNA-binding protein n=1 Tax=Mycoplana sp. BE70 TaxID=2817775 RepID=UPI00285E34FF|nr:NUMOD3 domain-containing DNA-binding protein [Mycoplana sp. BE70]MDR6757186.1 hypothetical protein [Mycoplana sp. BE70]